MICLFVLLIHYAFTAAVGSVGRHTRLAVRMAGECKANTGCCGLARGAARGELSACPQTIVARHHTRPIMEAPGTAPPVFERGHSQ